MSSPSCWRSPRGPKADLSTPASTGHTNGDAPRGSSGGAGRSSRARSGVMTPTGSWRCACGMTIVWPTSIRSASLMPFTRASVSGETPYAWPIRYRLSPRSTRCRTPAGPPHAASATATVTTATQPSRRTFLLGLLPPVAAEQLHEPTLAEVLLDETLRATSEPDQRLELVVAHREDEPAAGRELLDK